MQKDYIFNIFTAILTNKHGVTENQYILDKFKAQVQEVPKMREVLHVLIEIPLVIQWPWRQSCQFRE